MFPINESIFYPLFTIGPLILYGLAFTVITYIYAKSTRPRLAQNILMIAITAGFLSSILVAAAIFSRNMSCIHAAHAFYGIFLACPYLSVYAPLHKMIKQKESLKASKGATMTFIFIGYFFSAVAIVCGIVTAIVEPLLLDNYTEELQTAFIAIISIFLHVAWPLALIDIVLLFLLNKDLSKETRKSLWAFSIFMIVAVVMQTIMVWVPIYEFGWAGVVPIFLIDVPSVAAILIWFFAQQKDLTKYELSFKEIQSLANNSSSV
jgi:hypothetical protein